MEKKYLMIIAVFYFSNSFAQNKSDLYPVVNDSVKTKLYNFIKKESQFKVAAGMYIFNVLGEGSINDGKLINGVYKFKLMGSHLQTYYFIYTEKNGIQIIKDYSVENVIAVMSKYFLENEAVLDEKKKLDYLQVIIDELRKRQRVPGSITRLDN